MHTYRLFNHLVNFFVILILLNYLFLLLQQQDPLKVMNHGQNCSQAILWQQCISAIVKQSRSTPLLECTYLNANNIIVLAFCQRWQPNTNTFYMTFEKMMITLDDKASLLHIPIVGAIISFSQIKIDDVNDMLVEFLGVTPIEVADETSLLWVFSQATVVDGVFRCCY